MGREKGRRETAGYGDMEQIVDEASVLCGAKIGAEKKEKAKCRYQS